MACGTCGKGNSAIEIIRQTPKGIRTTRYSRMPTTKPIIPQVAKSVTAAKSLQSKARGSNGCPLCGSALMPVTQRSDDRQTTFLQCVGNGCSYKRKP